MSNKEPAKFSTFLYFPNQEVGDLIAFTLEHAFNAEVQAHSTIKTAVAALKDNIFSLVVIDSTRPEAMPLVEIANKGQMSVVIHNSETKAVAMEGLKLEGVFKEADIVNGISETMVKLGAARKDINDPSPTPVTPYFRVGVPLLLRTNPLVADVFIRLSTFKFVKLFNVGDPFEAADVEKYMGVKKIQFFYIKNEDAAAITEKMTAALEELLKKEPLVKEEVAPVSIAATEAAHELIRQVGFTPEVQKLVVTNVELILKEMASVTSLGQILANLNRDREKYIATHSHLLAEVGCALSIAMSWDSDVSFKKLTMAALLHDMCLSNQELCRIKDLKDFAAKREKFTSSDMEEYRGHSRRASVLIKGIPEVPADVDKIVLQHHELPIGTGFPEQINHVHIHPLASIMMVAHDLVDWVLDHPGKVDVGSFIEEHSDKYKQGNFKKILKSLEDLVV